MKNKAYIIILAVLSILFILSGTYGYILNSKQENKPIEEPKKYEITYLYYLENEMIETLPSNNQENKQYLFDKYTCTNGIIGTFDVQNWKFDSSSNVSGECSLYFVKANYEITLSITNGIEDETNNKLVNREKDGQFIIIPNEGYKYKESLCSDNKNGIWNETTNTFTLNSVTSDITCTIKFEKKELNVEVVVENGKGNTTEKVLYGDSKSIIVEPSIGYNNPKITCTNDQTAKYENNSINFEKVTNDTKCTISFNKVEVKTYNFEITNPTEFQDTITISNGDSKITNISEGKDITIALQSTKEDIKPMLYCKDNSGNSIKPTENSNETNNIKTFIFYNINKNITCTIGKE